MGISDNHYTVPAFRERMTTKQWQACLLSGRDNVIFAGHITPLKARRLGAGVVEVAKDLSDHPFYTKDGWRKTTPKEVNHE